MFEQSTGTNPFLADSDGDPLSYIPGQDLDPPGAPDGTINLQDMMLLMQLVL